MLSRIEARTIPHRIDDLEMCKFGVGGGVGIPHRIDDLEINVSHVTGVEIIPHRIDDLESEQC